MTKMNQLKERTTKFSLLARLSSVEYWDYTGLRLRLFLYQYCRSRRPLGTLLLLLQYGSRYRIFYVESMTVIGCQHNETLNLLYRFIDHKTASTQKLLNDSTGQQTCLPAGYTISNLFFSETQLLENHVSSWDLFGMNSSSSKNQQLEVSKVLDTSVVVFGCRQQSISKWYIRTLKRNSFFSVAVTGSKIASILISISLVFNKIGAIPFVTTCDAINADFLTSFLPGPSPPPAFTLF